MKNTSLLNENDVDTIPYQVTHPSPLGKLCILATDIGIKAIKIIEDVVPNETHNTHTERACDQLEEYFDHKRRVFDIDFDLGAHSIFTQKVWKLLTEIPYGTTISYMQLAVKVGDTKSIRAVGTANGRNPIPIIIPCHRVIGSDGNLTGFALGLDFKLSLLKLENPEKYGIIQGVFDF
ncbi:MAG: methylated-DNA--[protein]-cysteine S-methyltransferase [Saprospiraceae bacterium]